MIAVAVVTVAAMALIPISRIVEEFPHVRWDMVLTDALAALVIAVLGILGIWVTYMVVDWMVLEPIREIIQSIR